MSKMTLRFHPESIPESGAADECFTTDPIPEGKPIGVLITGELKSRLHPARVTMGVLCQVDIIAEQGQQTVTSRIYYGTVKLRKPDCRNTDPPHTAVFLATITDGK